MIQAQDWLNQKYPNSQAKSRVKSLQFMNRTKASYDSNWTAENGWFYFPETKELAGDLDLADFVNLESISISEAAGITSLQISHCQSLKYLSLYKLPNLQKIEGLTECSQLINLNPSACPQLQAPFTFLASWKQEIAELKAKITELETQPGETLSDPNETLPNKLTRKKQELNNLRTTGLGSTAFLRKEITLLERIQALSQQITQLEQRETNYQSQIRAKEQTINTQQTKLAQLEASGQAKQSQINNLNTQIVNLQREKQALEQRLITERQQALALWANEKSQLDNQINQLTEEKNTSRQAADYLRTTLSSTESSKADLIRQLAEEQANNQQMSEEHQTAKQALQEQLTAKQEAYILIQQRNTDLTSQLASKNEQTSKLTTWIERLEAASGSGNAFSNLQEELNNAQLRINELEGQLINKLPKNNNYYWIYALAILAILYIILKK